MSAENSKNMKEKDEFSKLVKQKLENHQLPVSDDIWAGIEQKMSAPAPQKRRIVPWYWFAGAAAAALVLFIWPIQNITNPTQKIAVKTELSKTERQPKPIVSTEEPASNSVDADFQHNPQSIPAAKSNAAGLFSKKPKNPTLHADNHLNTTISRTADKEERPTADAIGDSQETENNTAESSTEIQIKPAENENYSVKVQSKTNRIEKIDRLPDLNDYPEIPDQPKRTKIKRPMFIAGTFGTSGNATRTGMRQQDFAPQMNSAPPRQLVSKKVSDSYAGILTADDYSNAEHQSPLSVGVALEKPLTYRVSLESGLVYTYLKSIYRNPGSVDKNGTLQLHYIGIPLNVRVKAVKQSSWNLYATAGTMVEKGLRSFYNQAVDNMSVKSNTNVKSNIDGVQWSVSGGVGFDYKLSKDLSLFVEPKLVYYLENNQPMSARTEQPLNLGVNGGLRIEL